VIDADSHLFETRDTWRSRIDPAHRDDALSIDDDEQGWAWVTWRGRHLFAAEPQRPGRPDEIGRARLARERGQRAETRYDDLVPAAYSDATARAHLVRANGFDASVVFPNFGLIWEEMLAGDLPALHANLRAANRWMADAVHDGDGALLGVGQVSLRDPEWATAEIATLARAGVRLAMILPDPPLGRPLSDARHDTVWRSCVEHGMAIVFHVANFQGPFDRAWYRDDPEVGDRLVNSVFLWVAPALAITDLILNGTLERFPDLRVGIVELSAHWVPQFLVMIDGSSDFYAARHGAPYQTLSLRPSEYFLRQVRVSALPYERPARLTRHVGNELYMLGSDWPHAEGVEADAFDTSLTDEARDALLGANAAWLAGV
jgi:predicted TIM-barrel fold metal-dependent hydrolase